ncbi:NADP-dependent oxidoreductase [Pedobacter panaciterrae]|uniref:NADP-dependent oxidoreductase n=1 Tax=Pedobacter panaciterrae TaxID=363849 RepID=UPI002596CEAF|nr:NADP-dependent oxidoreductase [uncultured Pedobacter sp.]
MKAIILKEHGDPSNLILAEVPVPIPGVLEVLVKVKAIGINPADTYIRKMVELDYVFNGERPRILGWDIAGIVTEIGRGVTAFKIGDEVFGTVNYPGHDHAGHGRGYAEYVAAPVRDIALKPVNISFAQAGAATLAALTAWQPLSKAGIKPGDRVLIAPAGGGVGHFAVQIAKYFGAYVIAVTSTNKMEFVRGLGADQVIDYRKENFEDVIAPVDLVLDALRDDHVGRSLEVIRPGGRLISLFTAIQGTRWESVAKEKGINAYYNAVKSSGSDMMEIARLISQGSIVPYVSKSFRLEDAADAHREIEKDDAIGKIVLSL